MKTPHKVTITIQDNPDLKSCDVTVYFDPPCPKDEDQTHATQSALLALEAIRNRSSSKSAELRYDDGRTTKLERDP